jgi:hypothetical protein
MSRLVKGGAVAQAMNSRASSPPKASTAADQVRRVVALGEVYAEDEHLAAEGADLLLQFLELLPVASPEGDVGAFASEGSRGGGPVGS